jgi:hypothetical protein
MLNNCNSACVISASRLLLRLRAQDLPAGKISSSELHRFIYLLYFRFFLIEMMGLHICIKHTASYQKMRPHQANCTYTIFTRRIGYMVTPASYDLIFFSDMT